MSRGLTLVPLVLIASLAPLCSVQAQLASATQAGQVPGAAQMLRDLPPQTDMPALPALAPLAPLTPLAATQAAPEPSFVLKQVQVRGATALTPQRIAQTAEPFIGKTLSDQDLGALVAALRQRYDSIGLMLVKVGFPTQDVSKGLLTLDVVEPTLARITLPQGEGAPITSDRVQGLLSFFDVKAGGLLNTSALERVMFALNDTPGVQAKAALTPAGDEGVYNLSIALQARRAWDASLAEDNQGVVYAGRWRTTALARLNNPLGIGDNLDFQGLLSNSAGVKVGRLAYELPVGYTPARLSVAYAKVGYSLAGDFADLEAHGTARVLESNLSYPLIRSRTRTLMARVGAESKGLVDKLDAFESRSDKRILGVVAGLNYESRDNAMGGGFNGASVQFHWGHLRIRSEADQVYDASLGDYGTAGRFGKVELQYSRLQSVGRALSLYANVSQQLATRNLDPAEKISLGGPRGVRAYPTAEGASDEATLLTSELRYWVNRNLTVFALYDWAKGQLKRDGNPADLSDNHIQLHGAGVGLVATYPDWVTVKATLAWRGQRRAESEPSNDKPRLYVQALHTF
ncbi:MAG: ShlB/FhaC/HecB family hemolysin secretion/activation protein [Aquabacterium sp.]|nr:ShlB/FhaC/HecB family hemolysin secretion/activation protein [Aquabacterium sp.]